MTDRVRGLVGKLLNDEAWIDFESVGTKDTGVRASGSFHFDDADRIVIELGVRGLGRQYDT